MSVRTACIERAARWVMDHPARSWNNDWGETLQMYGLVRAGQVFERLDYVEYVRAWLQERMAAGLHFFPAEEPVDNERYRRGPTLEINGYCGSWGLNFVIPALHDALQIKVPSWLALQQLIGDYIRDRAVRTSEGGLKHGGRMETYWVDTIYYSVPGLAWLGRQLQDSSYIDDGANQLRLHADRLQDSDTALFYHCWKEPEAWTSGALWARGNGWITMSAAEWLTHAPGEHADREWVVNLLRDMTQTLLGLQSKRGLWHTVVDHEESYEEVSASAMFAFSLVRGVRLGVLEPDALDAARKCVVALEEYLAPDGAVIGVSGGTGPGEGDGAHYQMIPRGTYTWGTGAWLLAMSELQEMENGVKLGSGH